MGKTWPCSELGGSQPLLPRSVGLFSFCLPAICPLAACPPLPLSWSPWSVTFFLVFSRPVVLTRFFSLAVRDAVPACLCWSSGVGWQALWGVPFPCVVAGLCQVGFLWCGWFWPCSPLLAVCLGLLVPCHSCKPFQLGLGSALPWLVVAFSPAVLLLLGSCHSHGKV